jgi:hypothetical protein
LQEAHNLRRLVSRNAARHSESNFHGYLDAAGGNTLRVVSESLVENIGGLFSRAARFGNLPFHFARANLVLRDAAGFAGISLNHGRGSGLQLAGAPGGDQNISVVAVEAFDQFHGFSPL